MSFSCYKCGAESPATDPPTVYCPKCAGAIRESVALAQAKARGVGFMADGAPLASEHKPVTIFALGKSRCGLCGSVNLSPEYGLCVYGCGSYMQCEDCLAILDFREDKSD